MSGWAVRRFLVMVTAVPLIVGAQAPIDLGRVIDKSGEWQDERVSPHLAVQVGTHVYSNSQLRRALARMASDFLIIRSNFTSKDEAFKCSSAGVCNDHSDDKVHLEIVERLQDPESPFWQFLKGVDRHWVPAISPAVSSARPLKDGVVEIEGGKLDLSSVWTEHSGSVLNSMIGHKTAYKYAACVGPLTGSGDCVTPKVIQNGAKPVVDSGLSEGNYEFRIEKAISERSTGGSLGSVFNKGGMSSAKGAGAIASNKKPEFSAPIYLLVVTPQDFEQISPLYLEAERITALWENPADAEGARRAYLDFLGTKVTKQP